MTSFFAQDTYTRARLTLQGGVRYDGIGTGYPDVGAGGPGYQLMPTRIFYAAGTTDEIHWKDVTPRIGAVYDLFGNGKTAVKLNVGKYLTALTASNSDLDLNPLIRTALQTTRTWNDSFYPAGDPRRGNYVPDCDLIDPNANARVRPHGQPELRQGDLHEVVRSGAHSRLGQADLQLGDGRLGAAGGAAARRPHRRLLPPLVRQLLHREQPADGGGRLHAVQHPDSGRLTTAGRRGRHGDRALQPRAGEGRRRRICTRSCPRTSAT